MREALTPTTVASALNSPGFQAFKQLVYFTSPQPLAALIATVATELAGVRVFCQPSLCALVDEVIGSLVEQHS
jgi:hypothetical protein